MEPTGNNLPITNGMHNGRGHTGRPQASEYSRQPAEAMDSGARKQNAMTPRKRRPKRLRPGKPVPQPKPMWPIYLLIAGAILYFFMPWDLVPDFLLGPGQADDFGLFYVAYRKWKARKDGNSATQQFQRRADERMYHDDYAGRPQPIPSARFRDMAPQQKHGFFGRLFKAFVYVIGGGDL